MKTLILDRAGPTLTVRLHRPKERNAFNADLIAELAATFRGLDDDVRCVVLTGEGPMFCAGADIAWMKHSATLSEAENQRDAQVLAEMFAVIDQSPAVVIGLVNGLALGGGAGLVACCDMVAAKQSSSFGFTEVRLGLIPAVISPYVVNKIGASAARRYFLTGELFDANTARRMGLVHHVAAESHELIDTVQTWCDSVLSAGPQAVREAKKLLRTLPQLADDAVTHHVTGAIARLRIAPEAQEGLSAFLEKRRPTWARDR